MDFSLKHKSFLLYFTLAGSCSGLINNGLRISILINAVASNECIYGDVNDFFVCSGTARLQTAAHCRWAGVCGRDKRCCCCCCCSLITELLSVSLPCTCAETNWVESLCKQLPEQTDSRSSCDQLPQSSETQGRTALLVMLQRGALAEKHLSSLLLWFLCLSPCLLSGRGLRCKENMEWYNWGRGGGGFCGSVYIVMLE